MLRKFMSLDSTLILRPVAVTRINVDLRSQGKGNSIFEMAEQFSDFNCKPSDTKASSRWKSSQSGSVALSCRGRLAVWHLSLVNLVNLNMLNVDPGQASWGNT